MGGISVTTSVVAARVPNSDAERLVAKARARGETVSSHIAKLITDDLRRGPSAETEATRRIRPAAPEPQTAWTT
jgi:hypothetical protein